MTDELRVLDELERRLIAGCYGPATATEPGRRRRGRSLAAVADAGRVARNGAVPALVLAVAALVFVVAITVGLRHGHVAHPQRPGRPQSHLPVVRNYAHSGLPSLPRGSVAYYTAHLGASSSSPNPRDTFVLDTTQVGLLKPGAGPTRSTLTIRASGLKPTPPRSAYFVWLAPASYTTTTATFPTSLRPLPPYSLVGIVQPPIGADGELVARVPISVNVRKSSTRQFELLITVARHPNTRAPGRAVLLGVIS